MAENVCYSVVMCGSYELTAEDGRVCNSQQQTGVENGNKNLTGNHISVIGTAVS